MRMCNPLDLWPLREAAEREKLAIFGLCVPRKPAEITWAKVQQLWQGRLERPFRILRRLRRQGELLARLMELRTGQYRRIGKALAVLADFPEDWAWEEIEPIVGRKTARMVGLYSVPGARVAALDVHVVKRLAELYPRHVVPTLSLTQERYLRWEKLFLQTADELGLRPWRLDKLWWQEDFHEHRSLC